MSQWKHEQVQRQERFWEHVRRGLSWTTACEAVGVERRQGYRWRKAAGGRIPPGPRVVSARYLNLEKLSSFLRLLSSNINGASERNRVKLHAHGAILKMATSSIHPLGFQPCLP